LTIRAALPKEPKLPLPPQKKAPDAKKERYPSAKAFILQFSKQQFNWHKEGEGDRKAAWKSILSRSNLVIKCIIGDFISVH
jgi:hypothetical protein